MSSGVPVDRGSGDSVAKLRDCPALLKPKGNETSGHSGIPQSNFAFGFIDHWLDAKFHKQYSSCCSGVSLSAGEWGADIAREEKCGFAG